MQVESETNELVDGSLIDLCGATLLWRSAEGIAKGPVRLLCNQVHWISLKLLTFF